MCRCAQTSARSIRHDDGSKLLERLGERERAETLKNEAIMTKPMPVEQKEREAETAEAKKNEGSGTVPNVTPGQAKEGETKETKELKEAMHQFEEEKGDWAKSH
jgi:hypothetical protein